MMVLLPVIGWHGVVSSDEGAAIAQAQSFSDDGDFGVPNPFPAADPAGSAFEFEKSARTDGGFAPLPKRPAYTVLLGVADRLAGVPGMLLVSIFGTVDRRRA